MPKKTSKKRSQKGTTSSPKSKKKKRKSKAINRRLGFVSFAQSKAVAVHLAVTRQLQHDWHEIDMTKVMGTDYRYNQFTLPVFLTYVSHTLAASHYSFQFNAAFVGASLQSTLARFEAAITTATTSLLNLG